LHRGEKRYGYGDGSMSFAGEDAIRQVNAWLDQAERLARMR
jgi:hypothetical protein